MIINIETKKPSPKLPESPKNCLGKIFRKLILYKKNIDKNIIKGIKIFAIELFKINNVKNVITILLANKPSKPSI